MKYSPYHISYIYNSVFHFGHVVMAKDLDDALKVFLSHVIQHEQSIVNTRVTNIHKTGDLFLTFHYWEKRK